MGTGRPVEFTSTGCLLFGWFPSHDPGVRLTLETNNLRLIECRPEDWRAMTGGETAYQASFGFKPADGLRAFMVSDEVSPEFRKKLESAEGPDLWTWGFGVLHVGRGEVIGTCGFKGPPSEGCVEIAYGIVPEHQGKGYATETAGALVKYAFEKSDVTTVRAHTLPEENASTGVLKKCGFERVGEVNDPEDGLVWRWEKRR